MEKILQAAISARRHGVSVVPVELPGKRPPAGFSWKERQERLPDERTIRADLAGRNGSAGFAIIGGAVSGNLEIIDQDLGGEFSPHFEKLVEVEAPGLIGRLPKQKTPSGGDHYKYRCRQATIGKSQKLAHKRISVDGPGEHEHGGKRYTARQHGGKWFIFPVAIETRGEGGYAVSTPSPGYSIIQEGETGDFHDPPEITLTERKTLLRCARALDELPPQIVENGPPPSASNLSGMRPGEDFNRRGEVLSLLLKHGWKLAGGNAERQHLTRPGKERGISATLYEGRTIHNFSSNAAPFEMDKSYSAFAVFALLEHGGDFSAAARELGRQGYGEQTREKAEGPRSDPAEDREGPAEESSEKPKPGQKAEGGRPAAVGWCAADLMETEFPEPRWAVPGIIPEGLTLLAGKPKRGKSILATNLAITISGGGKALGWSQVEPGGVLYLALEDNPRWLYTQWPRMNEGGLELLSRDVDSHENLRLIIIDTLPKFRPPKPKNADPYQFDYETREGQPYLAVEYSSRLDWDEAIAAALAGSGFERKQLTVIIATPESTAGRPREDLFCST